MADKGMPPEKDPRGLDVLGGDFPLPVAVLDDAALQHNLATMAAYCAGTGMRMAPHGKTTMSPELIAWQMAHGAWGITAATAWQAATIASFGVDRIILANEVTDPGSLALLDRTLDDRPELELYCFADSPAAVRLLLGSAHPQRLRLLVELGVTGGRTGLRDDRAALDLADLITAGPAVLAGVAAFEGIIAESTTDATRERVDELLHRMARVARFIEAPVVTVGGSAWFDRVAAILPGAVLRSGCYLTHDAGSYAELSPFGANPRHELRFRQALHVWAAVLSRPEPGLALAGLGRRDASADAGLPVPQVVRRAGGRLEPLDAVVTVVNDQHAYLRIAPDLDLGPGDLVRFGISHPCTTFDKWRGIPLTDPAGTVLDIVHTHF